MRDIDEQRGYRPDTPARHVTMAPFSRAAAHARYAIRLKSAVKAARFYARRLRLLLRYA